MRYNERLFQWKDQVRLASVARTAAGRGAFVAVSGLDHFEFLNLYPGWWKATFSRNSRVGRDVASRVAINEAVVFSRFPSSTEVSSDLILKKI